MGDSFKIISKRNTDIISTNIDDYPGGIVIPLDKPYKWTSADAVRKVKFKLQRYFSKKNIKVGHAGTLDPLATGILLICIGKATKQAEMLQAQRKVYIAEIQFGATTPCFDLEKEIDATFPYEHISISEIEKILPNFIGEQQQVPPIFSAKLIDGVRAYQKARLGEDVQMRSSTITIYNMEILEFKSPILVLKIECSKGTYVRALARDLGKALNSGGFLTNLQRTSSGDFTMSDSVCIEDIENIFQKDED